MRGAQAPVPGDQGKPKTPSSEVDETYRDYAAYTYTDRAGTQMLSQWLISDDGVSYWSRNCKLGEKGGPDWSTCHAWGASRPIAGLGLPEFFGAVAGMGSFVFIKNSDPDRKPMYDTQWVAQTVFSERGDVRIGRVCPIEDTGANYANCNDWTSLEVLSAELEIGEASAFRDDSMYTYKDASGTDVFAQSLLSPDGTATWERSCPSLGGSPFVTVKECTFGAQTKMAKLGIDAASVSGRGWYLYMDGDVQKAAETIISADGRNSSRRICVVNTTSGIDWSGCGDWTTSSLVKASTSVAPL
ncbi:MAG: hypothetical protein ABIP39_05100 [Polyangiaceae bacterium]